VAIKKSELYSTLWASCNELRGGMDASQYKDYVLVLLFIKYVSDKYAGQPYAPIKIPRGSSFADMVALKGHTEIGERINKHIIAPLAEANKLSDFPDFDDSAKLGEGKEKVDKLTSLIAIFEDKRLDFSKNRADGDDILGDAYEYLMQHFATESGKSKGQFYTPAEVSRVIAQILEIGKAKTSASTTVYDPTCGSGSLLLKVAVEAKTSITLYGQEKDAATSSLARMNMILHNNPTASIAQGNTLTSPKFFDADMLKMFDYVVANPPFSDKRWSNGLDASKDPYERFDSFGIPPDKQGDFAYLLHIVRSLRSSGRGACILPHGVLFRGGSEAGIRKSLLRKGYIKGIIGLPPNLFYGTGIPACILVVEKKDAAARKGVFLIDASKGFLKDGPKNRLRDQDIHKIVDTFTRLQEIPKYSRMVSLEEIEGNDFNLNLPRYIDSSEPEELQDIEGHLHGGIPEADVKALEEYWEICPKLKSALFKKNRPGYLDLKVSKNDIKAAIFAHPEFISFTTQMEEHFEEWKKTTATALKKLAAGDHPKQIIQKLSEKLLEHYTDKPLVDKYGIYQHLMDYWSETMQDDFYQIATDGWTAETYRILETKKGKDGKPGKVVDKGWACDLIPKNLIVSRFFAKEQSAIDAMASELESVTSSLSELEEENGGEEGAFSELEKISKAEVARRLKEIKGDKSVKDEEAVLKEWQKLSDREAELKFQIRRADSELDDKALAHYPKLTESDIKSMVVNDKWLATLETRIHGDMDRISQQLTKRVKELAERYESTLPQLSDRVADLETKVAGHLAKMGFAL
jgi:type I restriction enzyme M protein